MRRTIRVIVVVCALAAATVVQAAPEHARLAAMCGTWDIEITLWTGPGTPSIRTKGTSTIRPLLGGLFIEEQIDAALGGTPIATLAWTGFNTTTKQYEATRISTTTTGRIAEAGAYDETTKRFELKADYAMGADTWHQRTVIDTPSVDAMTATSYFSFGSVPEWKGVEIKYTRKSK